MVTLVIQAGGKSSRMGQDKGIMLLQGKPLVMHVIDRLQPIANEIIITTNQPEHYRFLNLPLVQDIIPDHGALGGLYTALHAASYPLVAVVACDMPFASLNIFRHAKQLMEQGNWDVVIPRSRFGLEPMHAMYRRETCLPQIRQAIDEGMWKAISWHPRVRVKEISQKDIHHLASGTNPFFNINTPEDLKHAEKILSNKIT